MRWTASKYRAKQKHIYVPQIGWWIKGEEADSRVTRIRREKIQKQLLNDYYTEVFKERQGFNGLFGLLKVVNSPKNI